MAAYRVVTESMVELNITNNLTELVSQRRFPKDLTIAEFKQKLELITGCGASTVQLQCFTDDNKLVCLLEDDSKPIGFYPVDSGMRVHVTDAVGRGDLFADETVVKYEISDADYYARDESVDKYLRDNKLGKYKELTEEEKLAKEEENRRAQEEYERKLASIEVGSRCEVRVAKQPSRRGVVAYKGLISPTNDPSVVETRIGVSLDEPLGKNDGSLNGRRYFTCQLKYGCFVRPHQVEVGDFPELLDDELDEI